MVVFFAALHGSKCSQYQFGQTVEIDFTVQTNATSQATWSNSENIKCTKAGLQLQAPERPYLSDAERVWIETNPIPVGFSWEPLHGLKLFVTELPSFKDGKKENEIIPSTYAGRAFVRYSTDSKHWSSWLYLAEEEAQAELKKPAKRRYSGIVVIPEKEKFEYDKLVKEYATLAPLDDPWPEDQEAACKWILKKNPNFFQRNPPRIGYIQVLYEKPFEANESIRALEIEIIASTSREMRGPRNPKDFEERQKGHWRFKSE
jgi:hypothetical protein